MDEKFFEFIDIQMKRDQQQTLETYRHLNKVAKKGQILFTGSSLMAMFPVTELAATHELGKIVYNRGIGGFKTDDFLDNINEMLLDVEPATVFINIGTNDLALQANGESWESHLERQYDKILGILKEKLPETKAYVMAYYPMDESNEENKIFAEKFGSIRTNATLEVASEIAHSLADKYGYEFINVNEGLTDENGNLKKEFCKDAIHMYPNGYEVVYKNLEKYL